MRLHWAPQLRVRRVVVDHQHFEVGVVQSSDRVQRPDHHVRRLRMRRHMDAHHRCSCAANSRPRRTGPRPLAPDQRLPVLKRADKRGSEEQHAQRKREQQQDPGDGAQFSNGDEVREPHHRQGGERDVAAEQERATGMETRQPRYQHAHQDTDDRGGDQGCRQHTGDPHGGGERCDDRSSSDDPAWCPTAPFQQQEQRSERMCDSGCDEGSVKNIRRDRQQEDHFLLGPAQHRFQHCRHHGGRCSASLSAAASAP